MKNIWKIFTGDLKKLVKQPFALVIIIGLCVIPSLYAWFNIFSNWDPYSNTGGIPVAVVSLDQDYTKKDGSVVNMGESVLESLHSNASVKWIFLDTEEEAREGVEAGKYYAAIVITDKFTYSMYNVFSDDFENPSLIYYQNQKSNAIATKITDTVAGTLQNTINETFIKVAATTIFEEGNSVSDQMQGSNYAEEFRADLEKLNDNLKEYSAMIDTFRAGNDRLEAAISHVNYEIPAMQKKLDATTASLNQSSQNLTSTRDTLSNFNTNVDTSMSTIQTSLEDMKKILDQSKLADDTAQMTKDLNKVARDTNTLNGQVNDLLAALIEQRVQGSVSGGDASTGSGSGNTAADAAIEALKAMQKELDMMNTVIGSVLESTDEQAAEKAKVNVNNAMNNLKSVIDSCENSVSNLQGIYKNNLVPQMQRVLTNMSDSLNQVTNLVNTLSNTVQNIGVVMEGVGDAVDGTSESLGQIQGVVDGISEKLTDLTDQLEGASEEEMMDILVRFLGGDPDSLGEYFASPVTMETIAMYPVATYGSAMTPFYSTLAIWVGSTILVALVKVKASPKDLENVQSYQLYFGRYLLFLLLAQIQAAIIVAGDLWLLKVNIVEPGLFFLAASFTATAFSLLIYSLTLAFGDVGKAVCVIVMVLQIAGSSGTFPIELLPDIYQKIYIFFPFPYAITAMREALAGMYGTAYMAALAKLILFMLEGLLIGLVIRIPFVKLNHFVEERMEDTELM